MALDLTKLSVKSTNSAFNIYTYKSTDTKAEIGVDTYWNDQYNKILKQGDVIFFTSDTDTDTPDMGVWLIHNI